jgi:hypothetical protein
MIQRTQQRVGYPCSKQMFFYTLSNSFSFFIIFPGLILKYTCELINRTRQSQGVSILYGTQELPNSKLSQSIEILIGLFVVSLSPSSKIEEQKGTPIHNGLFQVFCNQSSPPGHSTQYPLFIARFDVIRTNKQTHTRSQLHSL